MISKKKKYEPLVQTKWFAVLFVVVVLSVSGEALKAVTEVSLDLDEPA